MSEELSDLELLNLGRAVRNTFIEIGREESRARTGKARSPTVNRKNDTPEFLRKIGALVYKHNQDPVQFAAIVRRVGMQSKNPFQFNMYSSPNYVARALKEAAQHAEAFASNVKVGSGKPGQGGDAVETRRVPAEIELISRIASVKTFLYLRNKSDAPDEENCKTMANTMMDLDPLACLLISRGEKRVWNTHYEEASSELSTRPDILAAVKSLKLNWEGFLD